MKLPLKYTETMKALLGEEYDAYLASFDEERFYGLRVNTLKLSAEEMAARGVFSLRPVPWCETGFYYDENASEKCGACGNTQCDCDERNAGADCGAATEFF